MTGTLAGALEVRQIPSHPDKLYADVDGYIENIDGRPVVTRIHVKYHMKVPKGKREAAERALSKHVERCPASESVRRGIAVEWESEIVEE